MVRWIPDAIKSLSHSSQQSRIPRLHVSGSSHENDEVEAMSAFLADPQTEYILQHVRRGEEQPVMEETPPRETRLLRYLLDERRQSDRRAY